MDIDQWDALDEYQRAYALAPALVKAQQASERCEACGGPKSECQNADNQHAYEVEFRRCYRTQAVMRAQKSREDLEGVLTVVTLNPAKKKSAQRKKG